MRKNYCKEIFWEAIRELRSLGITYLMIYKSLKINHCGFAISYLTNAVIYDLASELSKDSLSIITHATEVLYSYKKSEHLYLDNIPNIEIIDTTIFDRVGKDFCLNLNNGGREYSVTINSEVYTVDIPRTMATWSFAVYDNDIISYSGTGKLKDALMYRFHVCRSNNLKRVYIDINSGYFAKYKEYSCTSCLDCPLISAQSSIFPIPLFQRSIKELCSLYGSGLPTPADILRSAIYSLQCYSDVILCEKPESMPTNKEHNIHTAKYSDEDKIVMLPLKKYTYKYKKSKKRTHKGGHHKSPVAHNRRAYFRKSRGRGDYILQNGEFIYVGDKRGNYSYVRACQVNQYSSRVIIYQCPNQ